MPAPGLRVTTDRAAGAFFVVFSVFVLFECRRIPFGTLAEPGPGAFPVLLAVTLLACSVAVFLGGGVSKRFVDIAWTEWRHAAAILGTCVFLALSLERLGYRLTIFAALFALVALIERKRWLAAVVFAGGFSLGTYFLFSTLLRVPLPRGPFGL